MSRVASRTPHLHAREVSEACFWEEGTVMVLSCRLAVAIISTWHHGPHHDVERQWHSQPVWLQAMERQEDL
jgi:hypothetical protein